MKRFPRSGFALLLLPLLAAAALLATHPAQAKAFFHFTLVKSVPEDKATVASLPEVKLWFSEPPEAGSVSIRVLTARGVAVKTGEVAADKTDKKIYALAIPTTLPNGPYSIVWRGMADDGHVTTDTLSVTVTARH